MPLFWDRSPITITHDSQPQIRGMKPDQALAALRASAQRWSRFGNGCSSLFLRLEPTETVNTAATIDYVNRIVIRTQDWCNPLKPVKPPSPGEPDEIPCHDPWSLAVTSVTSRPADGSIIDADIELNLTGQNSFADLAIQPPRQPHEYDLESTMTHELGHLLGIAHSCIGPKDGPTSSKRDVRGAQVRDCEGLKPGDPEWNVLYYKDTRASPPHRDLPPADVEDFCSIYPRLPDEIIGEGAVGCAAGGRPRGGVAMAAALVMLGCFGLWRRRRLCRAARLQ